MTATRVTKKGQVTIPKEVREALGIVQGDYVVLAIDGDRAILSRIRKEHLADLKGRLPATRPCPGVREVRREVGQKLARRGRRPAR